jgi:membrane protease YdiL (CAAX protease family)
MVCSFAWVPAGAWAAASFGFDVQAEQCSDTRFLFKLLLWGPIVEEIVFRAGLQRRLMGSFPNSWVPNGIASVAFALMHYLFSGSLASLAVFAPSLALGWLYQRSDRLTWTVALHIGFNLIFLLSMCTLSAH